MTRPRTCPRCLREFALGQRYCPFDGEKLSHRGAQELAHGRPSSRQTGLYAGRYAVRGLLGRGAMTQVLLGEDVFTREPVAIKVLDATYANRPEVADRFRREAEALSRVRHPHVIQSLAAGRGEDGLPYHVLEHVSGEPLDELLRREPVLHPRLALRLLAQISSALEAIHDVGVVHRDIKPANLLLIGAEGPLWIVKLVDFGFAHLIGAGALTPPGTALGTVAYMSPEQTVGDVVDGRSDLYNVGVLAFRMLSGALPFDGEGVTLMARQLVEPLPPLRPGFDPRLNRIVAAATRKNPALRYPSARAMRRDLEQAMGPDQGPLGADSLPQGTDVYTPNPGLPRQAALFLYRRLGLTAPPWGD